MRFDVVTIFPGFFHGPLDYGIVGRALKLGLAEVHLHDLREFTEDRHRTVDDRPFGGGEGMILKPEPVFACVESLGVAASEQRAAQGQTVLLLSAGGRRFDQKMAEALAALNRVVMICGRYEGVDERIADQLADREVSVGDFVLSGGELPAALVLDAIVRLLPGALGNQESTRQESFTGGALREGAETLPGVGPDQEDLRGAPQSTVASGGLLDYPHYTRPAEFRGMAVPEVLLSGNHAQIRRWRRRMALEKTLRNRPDLLDKVKLGEQDEALIAEIGGRS